jgi:hypothetical protein
MRVGKRHAQRIRGQKTFESEVMPLRGRWIAAATPRKAPNLSFIAKRRPKSPPPHKAEAEVDPVEPKIRRRREP